jgi:hypothetical protein
MLNALLACLRQWVKQRLYLRLHPSDGALQRMVLRGGKADIKGQGALGFNFPTVSPVSALGPF